MERLARTLDYHEACCFVQNNPNSQCVCCDIMMRVENVPCASKIKPRFGAIASFVRTICFYDISSGEMEAIQPTNQMKSFAGWIATWEEADV